MRSLEYELFTVLPGLALPGVTVYCEKLEEAPVSRSDRNSAGVPERCVPGRRSRFFPAFLWTAERGCSLGNVGYPEFTGNPYPPGAIHALEVAVHIHDAHGVIPGCLPSAWA